MKNALKFVFVRNFTWSGKRGPVGGGHPEILDTLETISHALIGAGVAGFLARVIGG